MRLGQLDRVLKAGVYIITGGVGKIGLALARHLASEHGAKVTLMSRRALPGPDEWARVLADGEDPMAAAVRGFKEMKGRGASCCDSGRHG